MYITFEQSNNSISMVRGLSSGLFMTLRHMQSWQHLKMWDLLKVGPPIAQSLNCKILSIQGRILSIDEVSWKNSKL